MLRTNSFSYGSTAGILTSVSLIVGLNAATATKGAIASALLIVALADNLTDALSIHIYQESEQLEEKYAFKATLANFISRLMVSLSFVFLVILLPITSAMIAAGIWGLTLIVALTIVLARERKANAGYEVFKHVIVALVVLLASNFIGEWISTYHSQ